MKFLRDLKNLKHLDFSYTAVTGEALDWLPAPGAVESISLRQCPSLAHVGGFLAKATLLDSVDFWSSSVAASDLTALKNAKNLGFLNLDNTAADDEVLRVLPSEKLHYLLLNRTRVSDRGVETLARCRNVVGLYLSGTRVGDAGVSHLGGLEKLENLDLTSTNVGNSGMRALGTDLGLVKLSLGDTRVSDEGVKQLERLVQLTQLDLSGTRITDAGIGSLKAMSKLLSLNISRTFAGGDATVAVLRNFPSLDALEASGTKLDDRGLRTISGLQGLCTLDVSNTAIGDTGVKLLAGHESLQSLNLTGTHVGNSGVEALVECPNLTYLRLGNTQITDDAMIALRKHWLRSLDVSGTKITSRGILAWIDRPEPGVSVIDITDTKIVLPREFKPPVHERGRTILRAPFETEDKNDDSHKDRRRLGDRGEAAIRTKGRSRT